MDSLDSSQNNIINLINKELQHVNDKYGISERSDIIHISSMEDFQNLHDTILSDSKLHRGAMQEHCNKLLWQS